MGPFSLRRLLASTPLVVWVVTVAWALLLLLWSVLTPAFVGLDEDSHLDRSLDALRDPVRLVAAPPDDRVAVSLVFGQAALDVYAEPYRLELATGLPERRDGAFLADAAPARDRRPLADPGPPHDDAPSDLVNALGAPPPLYHAVLTSLLAVVPGWRGWSIDLLVGALRLVSVVTLAPLPLLLAALASTLNGRESLAIASSLVPFAVPQLAHIGAIVGPDALLLTLSGLLTVVLARVYRGDVAAATATRVGVVTTLAMLTSTAAVALPVAVTAAYAGARRRDPRLAVGAPLRRALLFAGPGIAWHVGAGLVGGWRLRGGSAIVVEDGVRSVGEWAGRALTALLQTSWGRFGWAEAGFAWWVAAVLTGVVIALVAVATWRRDLLLVVALIGPGMIVAFAGLASSLGPFVERGSLAATNGRLLLTAVPGLAVLALAGVQRLLPERLAPLTWRGVAALALVTQTAAWSIALGYFWSGSSASGPLAAIRSMVAWQPWPPTAIAAVALALAAAMVWLLRRLEGVTRIMVASGTPAGDGA